MNLQWLFGGLRRAVAETSGKTANGKGGGDKGKVCPDVYPALCAGHMKVMGVSAGYEPPGDIVPDERPEETAATAAAKMRRYFCGGE